MKTRIAELRRKAGLSQSELAELVGTKVTMLGKLERGERALTSAWIAKLAKALNVSQGAIFTAPADYVDAGYIEDNGSVVESESPSFFDDGTAIQVSAGEQIIGVLGKSIEHTQPKPVGKRSYMIINEKISIDLPKETEVIVDTTLGGSLRDELTNRLAMITIEGRDDPKEDERVLGMVVRPRGGNIFIVMPVGGVPMADAVIRRIDPVMQILMPIGGLG